MIDPQKFLFDIDYLFEKLKHRGVKKNQLKEIRSNLIRKRSEEKKINILYQLRNKINKDKSSLNKNRKKILKIKAKIKTREEKISIIYNKLDSLLLSIPNIPFENTNVDENMIIDKSDYFHELKHNFNYEVILEKLSLIDKEKGIILSGSKFIVYRGLGSSLLHFLINFLLTQNKKKGYLIFDIPYLIKKEGLINTGQLPKFQHDVYEIEKENLYLIPTSEVSLINFFQGKIITENDLPIKLCSYSPCFRKEAGATGKKEGKGIIRLHQFHKVELIKIVSPENSYEELNKLVSDVRSILDIFRIPYRVVELCQKELGFTSSKTYDIEVWLPVSKQWLEISSCSNCEDFQSRRAKIRIKIGKKKVIPHIINGSSLAIDRLIAVLCEYYYNEKTNKLELPDFFCLDNFPY